MLTTLRTLTRNLTHTIALQPKKKKKQLSVLHCEQKSWHGASGDLNLTNEGGLSDLSGFLRSGLVCLSVSKTTSLPGSEAACWHHNRDRCFPPKELFPLPQTNISSGWAGWIGSLHYHAAPFLVFFPPEAKTNWSVYAMRCLFFFWLRSINCCERFAVLSELRSVVIK